MFYELSKNVLILYSITYRSLSALYFMKIMWSVGCWGLLKFNFPSSQVWEAKIQSKIRFFIFPFSVKIFMSPKTLIIGSSKGFKVALNYVFLTPIECGNGIKSANCTLYPPYEEETIQKSANRKNALIVIISVTIKIQNFRQITSCVQFFFSCVGLCNWPTYRPKIILFLSSKCPFQAKLIQGG